MDGWLDNCLKGLLINWNKRVDFVPLRPKGDICPKLHFFADFRALYFCYEPASSFTVKILSSFLDGKDYRWAPESVLPRNSLNLVSHTVTAVMLLACVFLRRTIARMRGLNVDNRELELTSNCTIPEISRGRRHASSSESNFSTSPASSTLPLPDFHQPHSHVNRSYTNTYSSCSSFKLPNIIGMYVMNKQVTSSPGCCLSLLFLYTTMYIKKWQTFGIRFSIASGPYASWAEN